MRRWRNLLIAGVLVTFVVLCGLFNATKPRILVLHSAAEDSQWASKMDRGMRRALAENRRPVDVEWMYLAVASPTLPRRVEEARAEARRAIGRIKPDVLIAVDDEANALVARDYVGRDRPRILYVALDRSPAEYGYVGAPNVSGIAEQLPLAGVRDAVTDLFPGRTPTLAVVGVDDDTDRAQLAQVRAFDWGPVRVGDAALVSTAEGWRDVVARAAGADVLLVLSMEDLPDRDGAVVTAEELSRWMRDNAKPLPIGTCLCFVDGGGSLSFAPPAEFYGEDAIRLALDWLNNRATRAPPPAVQSAHFEVAVRQGQLAQRGIVLPPIYLEAARANGTLFQ
jgi:hypothetical protein